ncbi:MAG: cob(I)yrinic acid a,c-diamide adenosyltransferase [Planctomycetota bacterium]
MVKLNKIYTRTGDDGATGLGTGDRVPKDHPRVSAYGAVDEANAAVGLGVLEAEREGEPAIGELLRSIQHDLFDVGADLCVPVVAGESGGLRITPAQVSRLESAIDTHNESLEPLTSFVLPGGSALSVALHLARTIVRRAERLTVTLRTLEPEATSAEAVRYLNRLSDLLFVLARRANDDGRGDVLWLPGAHRGASEGPDGA